MKHLPFLLLFLFFATCALAQKRNVYFLKENGREVKHRDSADFIRIIQEPDSGSTHYSVVELYPDNTRKFIGQVSEFHPMLVYDGPTMRFFRNGKKSEHVEYVKGKPTGMAYYYHTNGKLKQSISYGDPGGMKKVFSFNDSITYKVVDIYDSLGSKMVDGGKGYAIMEGVDDILREEGKYLNGVKDSVWKGLYKDTGHFYEETYKNGTLTSGSQTLIDGTRINYTKLSSLPTYKGGVKRFFDVIMGRFIYPPDARQRSTRINFIVKFNIKPDGSVSDIQVLNSGFASVDKEAAYVVKKAGNWIPATLRGLPVQSSFSLPIGLGWGYGTPNLN